VELLAEVKIAFEPSQAILPFRAEMEPELRIVFDLLLLVRDPLLLIRFVGNSW
jgi:hypothetical protein